MIKKRSEHRLKKEIFVKNTILTKNWFVVSIFHEYPEHHMENIVLAICISYQKPKSNSLLSEHFSYKILKNSLIKQIFRTEATSVSLKQMMLISLLSFR